MKTPIEILNEAIKSNGLSIDRFGKNPNRGYMVSIRKDFEKIIPISDKNEVLKSIDENLKALQNIPDLNAYLGIWINENKVFIDISHRFDSKKIALNLAKDFNQLAIYDLNENKEIIL